jgi:hypothetical protein
VIEDDKSRAVAGYRFSWSAPSAIQTALTLRQAIWRKEDARWQVCGIPEVLYTDHGTDFTSVHLEQVGADLKMQLVFSQVGRPRGRGKIERFFQSVEQLFLERQPGMRPRKHGQDLWGREPSRSELGCFPWRNWSSDFGTGCWRTVTAGCKKGRAKGRRSAGKRGGFAEHASVPGGVGCVIGVGGKEASGAAEWDCL